MLRIGALISGSGTNLAAVMRACREGTVNGQVVFAGSDNPEAAGLEKAGAEGVPTFVIDYQAIIADYRRTPQNFALPDDADLDAVAARMHLGESLSPEKQRAFLSTRVAAEQQLLEAMASYPFDLLILAGFMRHLTPYFIDRINTDPAMPRIMNIHPALLPAFPGVDGYGDTWRYGCKVGGCTVHFIDYGEDSGPIIGQKAFDILPGDTLADIKKRGLALEWELYPECVQLFAQGRLEVRRQAYRLDNGHTAERPVVVIADGLTV